MAIKLTPLLPLLAAITGLSSQAADFLSPNGYSGMGLTPNADVISKSAGVISYDTVLPGAPNPLGHNVQIGFGLFDNVELIGRLASNDLKCNMFRAGACPPGVVLRDFSPSMKWTLPIDWLKQYNTRIAIGGTDIGGAAVNFRSNYGVATTTVGQFDISLGQAFAHKDTAMLDGTFGSVAWSPTPWGQLSVEKVGPNSWAHAGVNVPLTDSGINAWATYSRQINENPLTDRQWTGMGISIPIDRVNKLPRSAPPPSHRQLASIAPAELASKLEKNGFYNPKIGKAPSGKVVVEVESNSYQWDILDAAGVALGAIASAYADSKQDFDLIVSTRGIQQLHISGDSACVKAWFESDTGCDSLAILSLNNNSYDTSQITWAETAGWSFRPEAILIPALISTIGTEYGAFDFDMALNFNTVVPLWKGAYFDHSEIYPSDNFHSENFEPGKPLYSARITRFTNRRTVNQLLNFPSLNTHARLTAGTVYRTWDGAQLETTTQSNNGRHKLGLAYGSFKNDSLATNSEKTYNLTNYRYHYGDAQKTSTELTWGKFWGGDTGFLLAQRFWHGDTSLQIYVRRSRMSEAEPLVSFAGLQISLPLTPRKNAGFEHLSIRGSNQWSYTVETKVFDTDNRITGGYGEIPSIGASMEQMLNRDRNTTNYYESNRGRIKNAFSLLTSD